jgi:ubiquinone/menaquinone biosynthesis C-methylase UbiE
MSPSDFDAVRFKALERAGFNRIAARYADGAPLRQRLADALLDAASLEPGMRVLDLASGPALLAHDAARRVAPAGWVVASDIAEGMLVEARRRLAGSNPAIGENMSYVGADAEHLCIADRAFDRVLAGLALFMFPHPGQALAEIHRVLKPGGELVLSVWGEREAVPLIGRAQDCIARLLPPPGVARPTVFRFGTPETLTQTLHDAGFDAIRIEACDFECEFEDAEAYWQAFLDLAGGAAEALSRLPEATRQALREAVAEDLAPHERKPFGYCVPARALVACARA